MIIKIICIICVAGIVVLAAILLESKRENHTLAVTEYNIKDKRIKQPFRIVMLADLHNAEFGAENTALIDKIKKIHPDAILIPGDVIIGKAGVSPDVAIHFLNRIGSVAPTYISKGNHEMRTSLYTSQYGDIWERLYEETKQSVCWLINEEYKISTHNINIIGLDMDAGYYRRFRLRNMEDAYLKEQLPDLDRNAYTILLAHNPDYFQSYAKWGADLVLSGHVHGGMIILPGLGGLLSPMVRFFPKYYKGIYEYNNKKMILTGGLGGHTLKIRVNNKPEICMISLSGD